MYNEKTYALGSKRSVIREIFEYAKKRSAEIGAENVFDFSIGNPSVPAPEQVKQSMLNALNEIPSVELHGYTSAQGDLSVRQKISANLYTRFGAKIPAENLYMTCGAAASLTITIKALTCENDCFIVIAPFFTEYRVFIENAGAKVKVVKADEKTLQPDFGEFEKYGLYAFWAAANVVFVFYDIAVSQAAGFYMARLHANIKKYFLQYRYS